MKLSRIAGKGCTRRGKELFCACQSVPNRHLRQGLQDQEEEQQLAAAAPACFFTMKWIERLILGPQAQLLTLCQYQVLKVQPLKIEC